MSIQVLLLPEKGPLTGCTGECDNTAEFQKRPYTSLIKIVGVGCAGQSILNKCQSFNREYTETIAVNTNKLHLDRISADKKILIGKSLTRGLGAGGHSEIGRRAAELASSTIMDALKDTDFVFIVAGMGCGGTGSGASPVIARIAKELGATVISIVTLPFTVEKAHSKIPFDHIADLKAASDTFIMLENQKLLDYLPNLPMEQCCEVMNDLISRAIVALDEALRSGALVHLTLADVKAIMTAGESTGALLIAESKGESRIEEVVENLFAGKLHCADYRNARGALVLITGGRDLTLRDSERIATQIEARLSPSVNLIWGGKSLDSYEGLVRVTAFMTGIKEPG